MAVNGTLRDIAREAATKAPVPIGALVLVAFIVQMFLGHLDSAMKVQADIADRAKASLDTNTAAMQALVVRIELTNRERADEHERILEAVGERP